MIVIINVCCVMKTTTMTTTTEKSIHRYEIQKEQTRVMEHTASAITKIQKIQLFFQSKNYVVLVQRDGPVVCGREIAKRVSCMTDFRKIAMTDPEPYSSLY